VKIRAPETIVIDDGDVPNAVFATFGESQESHLRFAVDMLGKTHLLGIWRDRDCDVSGTDMVKWLRSTSSHGLIVDEVADSAIGFWNRMIDIGLVDSWAEERFEGSAIPVDIDSFDVLEKREPQSRSLRRGFS